MANISVCHQLINQRLLFFFFARFKPISNKLNIKIQESKTSKIFEFDPWFDRIAATYVTATMVSNTNLWRH